MAIKLSDLRYGGGGGAYTTPGMAVPGGAGGEDWFAQQGAPGGGAYQATTPFNKPGPGPDYVPYPGGGAPPAGGGRMSNAQAQQFFDQLFPGERVTPEQLEAARPQLEAAGFTLNPNASGRITDLTLPSGDTVDPIYGAGSGENRKQWLVHAAGGGGVGAGFEFSPGFQFRLGEGLKALERSAAARGTLLTGGTLKGLEKYAQNFASNEYGQRVNQLMDLSRLGMNAAGGAGNAAGAYGREGADLLTQIGNAQAGGTVGAANAWQPPLNFGTNLAQMYYLSRLYGGGGGGGAAGAPTPASGTTTAGAQPLPMGNPSVPGFAGWAQTYDPRYAWLGNVPGYPA